MQGRHVDGRKLRDLRERKGHQRPDLSRLSKVSVSWIKYIEIRGDQPSGVIAYRLADALGVDISAFTTEVSDEAAA